MQGPRRRYGWRCNPIGYQPNYTHIPNEKARNLREAVFLKSVCAAPGDHLVGALCRIVGFRRSDVVGSRVRGACDDSEGIATVPFLIRARSVVQVHPGPPFITREPAAGRTAHSGSGKTPGGRP